MYDYSLSPRRLLGFVERLRFEPMSIYRARLLGGEKHWDEHIGWGQTEELLAAICDGINQLILVTDAARTNRRPRKATPLQRPVVADQRIESQSVADFPIFQAVALTSG